MDVVHNLISALAIVSNKFVGPWPIHHSGAIISFKPVLLP